MKRSIEIKLPNMPSIMRYGKRFECVSCKIYWLGMWHCPQCGQIGHVAKPYSAGINRSMPNNALAPDFEKARRKNRD